MQTPTVGRIVTAVLVSPVNGTDLAPAIITRVWSQRDDASWTVNITAFPDCAQPLIMSSVKLVNDEQAAREAGGHAAYWPARAS